jgi:periplasmic protein CpxP/Spy
MRKTILAMVAMALMTINANAQDEQRRPERRFNKEEMVQHRVDGMAKELGLDSLQKASLAKLYAKYDDKMGFRMPPRRPEGAPKDSMEMKRPSEEEMKKMHEEMQKSREEFTAELKKILTTEQYTKYEELEKKHARRGGPRPDGPRDRR